MMTKPDSDIVNLGCGDDYHTDAWNVDQNPATDADQLVNLASPWPWPNDSFSELRAYHILEHLPDLESALREAHRVLEPGGRLIVEWPMGLNELADPDHEHRWVWDTPLYYTGARPWDADVGLTVVDRSVTLHSHAPGRLVYPHAAVLRGLLAVYGPGRWAFDMPATSGEFRVVFKNES